MFWRNRLARASCAILICVSLLIAMFVQRENLRAVEDRQTMKVISSSWKLSELVFEGQRLSHVLRGYLDGQSSLDDLQTRFEIFWSRVDLVNRLDMQGRPLLDHQYEQLKDLLEQGDPLIYQTPKPDVEKIASWLEVLSASIIQTRVTWIKEYGGSDARTLSPAAAEISQLRARWELVSASLVSVIVIYLLVEVGFASAAQRREMQLTEAARSASDAKSIFIANVSHEIRTPLNGIMGMSRVLSDSALDSEQRACLDVLEESGAILLATLNDVLDYSKLEADEFSFEMALFDLPEELHKTRALFAPVAAEKGLDLQLRIDESADCRLLGDARRLRQVVHNLISNALKFTSTGRVLIAVRYLPDKTSASVPSHADGLYLQVEDTGPGVPKALLGRIFEPFGQVDGSATRTEGGTGLGLTISRSICKSMGGSLTVSNLMPNGARFEVYLPFDRVESGSVEHCLPASATIERDVAAGLRVLVVDDNRTNRLVLRKFLGSLGVDPVEFESGAQLLAYLADEDADLILMDVQMPEMTGVEATRLLRAMPRLQAGGMPYVVAVTANAMEHQVATYLEAGMEELLTKPVNRSALAEIVYDAAVRKADGGVERDLPALPIAASGA